jgi:protein-disulfide isomerase
MSAQLKPIVDHADHIQGNPGAPVTLVEYGDYQCPHCGYAYPIVKSVQENFGDRLRFTFRNFPLKNIHPLAIRAAIAAEAASSQNKFWEMHDAIFENQRHLNDDSFRYLAGKLNLDMEQFERDSNDDDVIEKVNNDFESGIVSGVNGTPTFFINGTRHNGTPELADLMAAIKNALV